MPSRGYTLVDNTCMVLEVEMRRSQTSQIEAFWEKQSTEDPTVPAKWGYEAALLKITEGPTYVLAATDEDLNFTSIVNPDTYQAQWNTLTSVQRENVVEGAFG